MRHLIFVISLLIANLSFAQPSDSIVLIKVPRAAASSPYQQTSLIVKVLDKNTHDRIDLGLVSVNDVMIELESKRDLKVWLKANRQSYKVRATPTFWEKSRDYNFTINLDYYYEIEIYVNPLRSVSESGKAKNNL